MLAWWWPHVQISSYQSSRHLDMSFFISDISIEVCGAWQKTLSVTTRGLFPPSLWYNHHHLFFKWDFDLDDCIAFKISHHAMLHGRNSEKSVDSNKILSWNCGLWWNPSNENSSNEDNIYIPCRNSFWNIVITTQNDREVITSTWFIFCVPFIVK